MPNPPDSPQPESQKEQFTLDVLGMHCASCSARVEKTLSRLPGVSNARVNLATSQASVQADREKISAAALIEAVERAGYQASVSNTSAAAADEGPFARQESEILAWRRRLAVAVALLIPLLVATHAPWPSGQAKLWIQLLLALPIQVYVGWPYFAGAWRNLCHGAANMDTLIALGTGTAFAAGLTQFGSGILSTSTSSNPSGAGAMYFADAAMILTFITLGKWLEGKARHRASRAIRRLLDLRPATANVARGETYKTVPVEEVPTGEMILVCPGEKVPLDAEITSGRSAVDQAWLTGESMPVNKQPSDTIFAGTINLDGSLVARVTRGTGQTALAQVIELVRHAQESKPRLGRLADRAVAWFVPCVLLVAAVTLLVWGPIVGDWALALRSTVAVLVVACPCALGLATPMAILVAGGRGAEQGILIKDAQALETAAKLDTIVFDKTGTITTGRPRVVSVLASDGISEETLLATAAAVERLSTHPLATAVVDEARRRGLPIRTAEELENLPGIGVRATLDGRTVWVGGTEVLETASVDPQPAIARANQLREDGQMPLLIIDENKLLGLVGLADLVADGAKRAIEQLGSWNLRTVLLSGDHETTARRIGDQLGIEEVIADVLPDEKQKVVHQLQQSGRVVAMVGDGINDSPALATADLGIAIGSGADVAIEAADVVLSAGNLRAVERTILLGRATVRTIWQNLFWAFLYNLILLPLAAGVLIPIFGWSLPPSAAAAAMAASSVSVVVNSLMLRVRSRVD